MKVRSESDVARRGLTERELKLGPGGIRDIEFAVQLLQLVHGGADPELRVQTTLAALDELADAGYVGRHDAEQLSAAYRFLRTVEHRLQLDDEQQIHALPTDEIELDRLARVLGYAGTTTASATERFIDELRHHQSVARAIHERLWFRPLLEDFARGDDRVLTEEVAATRLAAFGFTDVERTRQAVRELTRGLTRASRLMQQMLPLLLDWLSSSPDPDLGLLGLRNLASGPQRSMELATAFRESPEVAQRLCRLLGTSRLLGELLRRNPDMIDSLGDPDALRLRSRDELVAGTRAALEWRGDTAERWLALKRFTDREGLRVAAHDVLDLIDVHQVEYALTNLAEASLEAALAELQPQLPFARDRARSLGRRRAVVRKRSRRRLRVRGVHRGRLRGRRAAGGLAAVVGRRQPAAHLRHRRRPQARGEGRPAGPQPRRLPRVLRPLGTAVGATGDGPGSTGRRRSGGGAQVHATP